MEGQADEAYCSDASDLSDESYDTDTLSEDDDDHFNIEESQRDDFEATDLLDDGFDVDNQIPLYGGNVHPPEYYRQSIKEPAQRERYARYALKTRLRLVEVEDQWRKYVTHNTHSFSRHSF